jgi:hypothetical protein
MPGLFAVIPANLGSASGAGAGIPVRREGPSPSFERPPVAPTPRFKFGVITPLA